MCRESCFDTMSCSLITQNKKCAYSVVEKNVFTIKRRAKYRLVEAAAPYQCADTECVRKGPSCKEIKYIFSGKTNPNKSSSGDKIPERDVTYHLM